MKSKKLPKTNAERLRLFRSRRAAAELCIDCGKKIGPLGTKTRCRACANAHRDYVEDRRKADAFYGKPNDRKEHQKWLEENTLPDDFAFTPVVIGSDPPEEYPPKRDQDLSA